MLMIGVLIWAIPCMAAYALLFWYVWHTIARSRWLGAVRRSYTYQSFMLRASSFVVLIALLIGWVFYLIGWYAAGLIHRLSVIWRRL